MNNMGNQLDATIKAY